MVVRQQLPHLPVVAAPTAAQRAVPHDDAAAIGPSAEAPGRRTVEVKPDDTYWELAERELGDGLRWREVREANVGRTMPDGQVISGTSDLLLAGWVLVLPDGPSTSAGSAAAVVDEQAPKQGSVDREVRPGESIWRIAEDHLASGLGRTPGLGEVAAYCDVVVEQNRERLVDAGNPDLIYPGQVIRVPKSPK
jgi:nucleoid-associated protein YgaU